MSRLLTSYIFLNYSKDVGLFIIPLEIGRVTNLEIVFVMNLQIVLYICGYTKLALFTTCKLHLSQV